MYYLFIIFFASSQRFTTLYSGVYTSNDLMYKYKFNKEILCVVSYRIYEYLDKSKFKPLKKNKIIDINKLNDFTNKKFNLGFYFDSNEYLFKYIDVVQKKEYTTIVNIHHLFNICLNYDIIDKCKNKKTFPILRTCDYIKYYKKIEKNIEKYNDLYLGFIIGFKSSKINIIDVYKEKLLFNFNYHNDLFH